MATRKSGGDPPAPRQVGTPGVPDRLSGQALLPQHAALIHASSITDEVAAARDYRSVQSRAELRRLGFSDKQARVPALLIPVRNVYGEIVLYQIRPDEPRIIKGKAVKYETPRGASMILDVPPTARQWIGNPHRPLFITEGARKADAAVSRGLCCIAVLGVWNWRGRNKDGGLTALADWESIALRNRDVYLVFDSDVVTKIQVWAALRRLHKFLESKGASVRVVRLPLGEGGSKVGLDDYLAAGHSVENLLTLTTDALPMDSRDAETEPDTAPYLIDSGHLCVERDTRDGPVIVPLCNFVAEVTEEIELDDGVNVARSFGIDGKIDSGRGLPAIRVPVDRFPSLSWVTGQWGLHAVIRAGAATRDQLREAIQRFSGTAKRRRVFTHTGWRLLDNRHVYLSAAGAVGAQGLEVDLGEELARYSLPPQPSDPAQAMRHSLALLRVAPYSVTVPLWAATFRAVLASALPLDLSVWVEGVTGSLKSTLLALFLGHWGRFSRTNLPGSWSSTINSLEKRAFVLKDVMFVVDDYAPGPHDRRELEMKAARLLRAQGNLAGRSRLQSDLSERKTFWPRGLIVGTGEQRPVGQSVLARTFPIELDRSVVDMKHLTRAQGEAEHLPHALAAFVTWLAPQMGSMPDLLRDAFQAARARASSDDAHLRIPEAVAHLWVGLDCGLAFAEEANACDRVEAEELRSAAWEALIERAKAQGTSVDEETPARRFLEILATLVIQRRAVLLDKDGSAIRARPDGSFVGWYDDERLYLLPDAAFQTVAHAARDAGEPFPVGRTRLQQDLRRMEISETSPGRTTFTAWVGGVSQRVLCLRKAAVSGVLGEGNALTLPVLTGLTGFAE